MGKVKELHHDRYTVAIDRAALFSVALHYGQHRKVPHDMYSTHPHRVAKRMAGIVRGCGCSDFLGSAMICAAYLHDTIEDVPEFDESRLFALMGADELAGRILEYVKALTKPERSAGNRATRNKIVNDQMEKAELPVRVLKAADRADNLRDWAEGYDVDFLKRYRQESGELVAALQKPVLSSTDPHLTLEVETKLKSSLDKLLAEITYTISLPLWDAQPIENRWAFGHKLLGRKPQTS